jgi:hypothetical protein
MVRFFDFYDPLERRYVFNSFLVVVALVELLILIFTFIWQIDFEGIFGAPARTLTPFPWKEYLLASFIAPIALLFLFGLIIQGFEVLCQPPETTQGGGGRRLWQARYLLGLLVFMAVLVFFFTGKAAFALIASCIKAIGLGGGYLVIALLVLGFLYLWVRLILRYRLQKKAMEYQYLLTLAKRHGVIVVDPKAHPELLAAQEAKKNLPDEAPLCLDSPESSADSEPQ